METILPHRSWTPALAGETVMFLYLLSLSFHVGTLFSNLAIPHRKYVHSP